jgi:hypothetical protein
MGWLRKKAKKVFKSIKKVFNKIGSAFGKLGVLGQVGMMLLMPTMSGALGSFFGKAGTLSKWSSSLLKAKGIGAKALGHGLNMINKAATFGGKVYTTVTEGISNGLDRVTNFAKGKGFGLSEDRTSIFAKDVPATTTPESLKQIKDAVKPVDVTTAAPEDLRSFFEQNYKEAVTPKIKPSEVVEGLTDVAEITKPLDVGLLTKPKDTSFMDTLKGIPGEVKKGIQEFDVKEAVTTGLEKSATTSIFMKGKQEGLELLGYDMPEGPQYTFIDTGNVIDNLLVSPQSYQSMDYSFQQQGNNFTLPNLQNANALNNMVEQNNADYQNFMTNFAVGEMSAADDFIRQGY